MGTLEVGGQIRGRCGPIVSSTVVRRFYFKMEWNIEYLNFARCHVGLDFGSSLQTLDCAYNGRPLVPFPSPRPIPQPPVNETLIV